MKTLTYSKALVYLTISSLIWGVAAIAIKVGLNYFTPIVFLFLRFTLSSLFLLRSKNKNPSVFKKNLPMVLLYCLLSAPIGLGLIFLGVSQTGILNLSIATIVAPAATMIAACLLIGEKLNNQEKVGAAVAIVGATIIGVEPLFRGNGGLDGALFGNLLLLGWVMSDAASVVILKTLMKQKIDAKHLTDFSFLVGLVCLLPIIILVPENSKEVLTILARIDPLAIIILVFMAFFSGNIAFTLRAQAQRALKVEEVSLFSYLTPLVSVPLAVIFLNETVSQTFLIGSMVTITGVIISELKHFKGLGAR